MLLRSPPILQLVGARCPGMCTVDADTRLSIYATATSCQFKFNTRQLHHRLLRRPSVRRWCLTFILPEEEGGWFRRRLLALNKALEYRSVALRCFVTMLETFLLAVSVCFSKSTYSFHWRHNLVDNAQIRCVLMRGEVSDSQKIILQDYLALYVYIYIYHDSTYHSRQCAVLILTECMISRVYVPVIRDRPCVPRQWVELSNRARRARSRVC